LVASADVRIPGGRFLVSVNPTDSILSIQEHVFGREGIPFLIPVLLWAFSRRSGRSGDPTFALFSPADGGKKEKKKVFTTKKRVVHKVKKVQAA
jgi:hypothetical protein